jgi:hypothetical protein
VAQTVKIDNPPLPPFSKGGGVKKLEYVPLTLPSPARGEGEQTEIKKEIPSPLMGEGEGGGDLWDFFTPSGG